MNESEKEILKGKIKKIMLDHLTQLGYPSIPDEAIMRELKPMWLKIEQAGLVVDGMNFAAFQAFANNSYMMAQVEDILGI